MMTGEGTRTYVPLLIRQRREKKGWSQLDLAEKLGVTRNSINRWERGWNEPVSAHQRLLAKFLGGRRNEYEWTEDDYARRDRLAQAMIEVRALTRKLIAGELDQP